VSKCSTSDDAYGIKCSQAKQYLETENVKALADTRLQENYDANQMQRAVLVAALCVRQSAVWRPSMSQVLAYILSSINSLLKFMQ
jgi:hypothetical protein